MRLLGYWAAVAGTTVFCASGCLTSQEDTGGDDGGEFEDPPITIEKGGSGGGSQGGDAGEPSGGSNPTGGRAGASGSGSGKGGSDSGCSDDTDCELRVGSPRCSVPTGECVECLTVSDCGGASECVNNECRPITPCATTENCPQGQVCNPSTDICVECITSNDCRADEECAGNVCRPSCTVDGHCAPFGLVCGGSGYCVSCLSDSDCPEDRNCQNGTCARDICVGGSGSCEGNVLTSCNEAGSVLSSPTSCTTGYSCLEQGSEAACEPWICTPGTTGCSLTTEAVVECSADGLEETVIQACATGEFCISSTSSCMTTIYNPSTRFCMGNVVHQCDSTGSTSTPVQTCTTAQFCQESGTTAACVALLCTPNTPACDGNVYTTCNAMGTGYTGTRTDCTATDQFCGPSGCTTSSIDTVPASPTLYTSGALGNYLMLNYYTVTGDRTLSRIEFYANPASATQISWLVYEATVQTSTYTRLSITTTTSTTGEGYQASGALSVPLVAGRFYAIGVAWTTPVMLFGYQTGVTPTQTTSFGALFSAYVVNNGTPPTSVPYTSPSSYFFPQRLTTTP